MREKILHQSSAVVMMPIITITTDPIIVDWSEVWFQYYINQDKDRGLVKAQYRATRLLQMRSPKRK